MRNDFVDFLRVLASFFKTENRLEGDAAATALLVAANQSPIPAVSDSPMSETLCHETLTHAPIAGLERFAGVLNQLNWHHAGYEDGRIRPDIARRMYTAQLIGPDGPIFNTDLRAGVFLQEAGLDYVTRSHAAEECFHILAGEAYWSIHDGKQTPHGAGAAVFHPSNVPHRSETRTQPMLAAWRWSGDIGWGSYQLKG